MDAHAWPRIRALFENALDLPVPERASYVERESGDLEVRREVLRLLASESTGFDVLRPPGPQTWRDSLHAWQPAMGERIGSFTLERRLAAGGMGTVYAARQERPSRAVALKLMHSVQVCDDARRRFEIEAEILGALRHPGIAAIYELGTHPAPDGSGVPFFAMEFVEGARDIVSFARAESLDLHAQIELFRELCAAVQHAHQKGVIHRDLKPGNVLVSSTGRIKVIDYGVARVVAADIAGAVRTRAGEVFGTLQYMSPEQLTGASDDVDTRSDVYALGLILYELLAGRPPYSVAGLALAQVVAEVCQRTPLPPSRHARGLSREIDWIVLKVLSKEREQRYDSAAALADDLARFTRNEPVVAGPPTRRYRLAKFVARNRVLVGAAGVVAASLVIGLVVATRARAAAETRRVEAETARAQASAEAQKAREALRRQTAIVDAVQQLLAAVQPNQDGRKVTVLELLERKRADLDTGLESDPELRAAFQFFLVRAYFSLGLNEPAAELAESALATLDRASDPDPYLRTKLSEWLASLRIAQNRIDEARELQAQADRSRAQDPEATPTDELYAQHAQARLLEAQGRYEDSTAAMREVVRRAQELLAREEPLTSIAMAELAVLLASQGEGDEALEWARKAHELALETFGPDSPYSLIVGMRLGDVLRRVRAFDEAVPLQRQIVAGMTESFGEAHTNTLQAVHALALSLIEQGELDEAEALARRALALTREHHPDDSIEIELWLRDALASVLGARGDTQSQAAELRALIERRGAAGVPPDAGLIELRQALLELELAAGRAAEAEALARANRDLAGELYAPDHPLLARARGRLGRVMLARGEHAQAELELRAAHEGLSSASAPGLKVARLRVLEDLVAVYDALGRAGERERFRALLEVAPGR